MLYRLWQEWVVVAWEGKVRAEAMAETEIEAEMGMLGTILTLAVHIG